MKEKRGFNLDFLGINNKKAQVTMEYLVIFLFASVFIVITTYLVYDNYESYEKALVETRVDNVAGKLVETAEKIEYYGDPSLTTLEVNMPGMIDSMSIQRGTGDLELRFTLNYENNPKIIASTELDLRFCEDEDGNVAEFPENYFTKGRKRFKIRAREDNYVDICLEGGN